MSLKSIAPSPDDPPPSAKSLRALPLSLSARLRLILSGANPALNSRLRVLRAFALLFMLTTFGAAGFVLLEDMQWLRAAYLSVVTMSTVGYGDYAPVTPGGQIFTMLLIMTGVGVVLHLVSVIASDVFEGRLTDFYQRSSMMKEIERQSGHVIVCGYGRYGRVVADELERDGRTVVVIDEDPELEPALSEGGLRYIMGSATDDENLQDAGIKRADAIVIATSDDATSVFIALSARELNPEILIHARGESDAAIRRLKRAGANFVNSPFQSGGMRTAASILRPSVVDFLDLSLPNSTLEIDLEEIRTDEHSELVGATVEEIERRGSQLKVIAFRRSDQSIQLVPGPKARVEPGDHLVVVGERTDLSNLARQALRRGS